MLSADIYRTRIFHSRRAPVRHSFTHRGYSWYVDLDDMPVLPWYLKPFAGFRAADHLWAPESGPDTLRRRVEKFLAERGVDLEGGRVTALFQARVLGYVFNPMSAFWCHDRDGVLRHVVVEVHNTYGQRHAYLLPAGDEPARVTKEFYVSPFNAVEGHYLVRAPLPGETLDFTIALHRKQSPAFFASLRGTRRPATPAHVLRAQAIAPLAPLIGSLWIRIHGIALWLRRVPVVPRTETERVTHA